MTEAIDASSSAGRIVVGVDGSEPSKEALRWARRVAAGTGAEIDAIAAWQLPQTFEWGYVATDWNPEKDAQAALEAALGDVFGAERPAGLREIVVEGNAAQVLLERSKGAEILIVGSRGHGGFVGLLIGSVSAYCAEHAQCPVLVVHAQHKPDDAG